MTMALIIVVGSILGLLLLCPIIIVVHTGLKEDARRKRNKLSAEKRERAMHPNSNRKNYK